jgi:signal transduction histidine kinase
MAAAPPSAPTDALDIVAALLSEADGQAPSPHFYDGICEALCRLTSMERAAVFLYHEARRVVVPVGCAGLERSLLTNVYGTLEETPVAQRALAEGRVLEVSDDLEREIPARYARFAGVTTLTCIPVSAGDRWLGVIFADRGGGAFKLTEEERATMAMLGKTAALATSARFATRQQERSRQLAGRIDLAREIHERAMQRLFGVSLVLGSGHELTAAERARCHDEIGAALGDLRTALSRPLAPSVRETGTSLREELDRLGGGAGLAMDVDWQDGLELPSELEPLFQSVLREALRNARKHAAPSVVSISLRRHEGALELEIVNDGARDSAHGSGMGLRLAALEALERGGLVEFGPAGKGSWRVRLVVPEVAT